MSRYQEACRVSRQIMALLICALLSTQFTANSQNQRMAVFALCSANVKNIIVAKKVDGNAYRLVITLNTLGAEQFRQMEAQYFGQIVNVEWAGVSVGAQRLHIDVPKGAKQLLLGSRWMNREAAEGKVNLIGRKLLQSRAQRTQCGFVRDYKVSG